MQNKTGKRREKDPNKIVYQKTYILLNIVQATIIGHKGCNLLSIFDQLNTSTLSNSRIRLLSFNPTAQTSKYTYAQFLLTSKTKHRLCKNEMHKSHIFSRTIPLAWDDPANGFFHSFPRWDFLQDLSAHLCLLR